ncbi:MAG: hypothetical protein ACYDAO_03955 [Thermoplasmataceae archaeon]
MNSASFKESANFLSINILGKRFLFIVDMGLIDLRFSNKSILIPFGEISLNIVE